MSEADNSLEQRLKARLATLRDEYKLGQEQFAALDARSADLRQTMLRIAGAIQVIEEAIGDAGSGSAPDAGLAP